MQAIEYINWMCISKFYDDFEQRWFHPGDKCINATFYPETEEGQILHIIMEAYNNGGDVKTFHINTDFDTVWFEQHFSTNKDSLKNVLEENDDVDGLIENIAFYNEEIKRHESEIVRCKERLEKNKAKLQIKQPWRDSL